MWTQLFEWLVISVRPDGWIYNTDSPNRFIVLTLKKLPKTFRILPKRSQCWRPSHRRNAARKRSCKWAFRCRHNYWNQSFIYADVFSVKYFKSNLKISRSDMRLNLCKNVTFVFWRNFMRLRFQKTLKFDV